MYYDNHVNIEIPADEQFDTQTLQGTKFRAQWYAYIVTTWATPWQGEWRLGGTRINKDGSLHKTGLQEYRVLSDVMPGIREAVIQQYRQRAEMAQAHYAQLADLAGATVSQP